MKTRLLALIVSLWATFSLQAQTNERYIEVTGTSEIEIVPDKIHYVIEIREYFEEEFDGKSKPEEYRTKVPLSEIEQGLREALAQAFIRNRTRIERSTRPSGHSAKCHPDTGNRRLLATTRARLLSLQEV